MAVVQSAAYPLEEEDESDASGLAPPPDESTTRRDGMEVEENTDGDMGRDGGVKRLNDVSALDLLLVQLLVYLFHHLLYTNHSLFVL